MTFLEAQKYLREGETIFRKAWNGEKVLEPKKEVNIFHITQEDMEADDWETQGQSKESVSITITEPEFRDLVINKVTRLVKEKKIDQLMGMLITCIIADISKSLFKSKGDK